MNPRFLTIILSQLAMVSGLLFGQSSASVKPVRRVPSIMPGKLKLAAEQPCSLFAAVDERFVLLLWTGVKNAVGYNLYRSPTPEQREKYEPVNTTPIMPITDCSTISGLIQSHSPEAGALKGKLGISPCDIQTVPEGVDSLTWCQIRSMLGQTYYKIGLVMGLAYLDSSPVGDTRYYRLTAQIGRAETTLVTDYPVATGIVKTLGAPTLTADSGDGQVFLHWNEITGAIGYDVYRATGKGGTYSLMNSSLVVGKFIINPITTTTGKTPDTLKTSSGEIGKPGFLDTACTNNTTYYYKVVGYNLLGYAGNYSKEVSATPRDKTPPLTPAGITVTALYGTSYGLQLAWPQVQTDEKGHSEGIAGYHAYRYSSYDAAMKDTLGAAGNKIGSVKPPADSLIITKKLIKEFTYGYDTVKVKPNVFFEDLYPQVKPDLVYWYRIQSVDSALPTPNKSRLSAAVNGSFKDTIPPKPPANLVTDAYEDSILLAWSLPLTSTDGTPLADLAGFNVYRGICGCESVYVYKDRSGNEKEESTYLKNPDKQGLLFIKSFCRPYALGQLANIDSATVTKYTDRSLPKGSPVCYRYALKAYDKNQNLSPMSDSICDRLKDRTGPPAPILSGMKARDRAVRVEWVAPPVQDLLGFLLERSTSSTGPWQIIKPGGAACSLLVPVHSKPTGTYVEVKPATSIPDPKSVGCKDIPATSVWSNSIFFFTDSAKVDAEKNYFYRIRAVDYLGNVGDTASPEIGTFTYDRHLPPQPTHLQTSSNVRCGVTITWQPAYDTTYLGFAVFRSKDSNAGYRQISALIRGNSFNDENVIPAETYYYRVQYFAKNGNRSLPSQIKSYTVP